MKQVPTFWKVIKAILAENEPAAFRALRPPAPEGHIDRLQQRLGVRLPATFVRSLRRHDGMANSYLGVNRLFNYWALLPLTAIEKEWRSMGAVEKDLDPGGCSLTKTRKLKNDRWWRPRWVPVLDADGDKLVLDLDPGPAGRSGQVFRFSNTGSSARRVVALSFRDWLGRVAQELVRGRFTFSEADGLWLKSLDFV
jgi:cell wall assembly regulator SMI1